MKPEDQAQDDLLLFQAHFDQLLNKQYPLIKLAKQFDWEHFEKKHHHFRGPTDSKLLYKAIIKLVDAAKARKLLRLLPRALAIRLNHWLAQQQFNRHDCQLRLDDGWGEAFSGTTT